MIRIALVDDNPKELADLRDKIGESLTALNAEFSLDTYENGSALLEAYHAQYHLLCLDIDMPVMDGMTLAGKIREMDSHVLIMFITNLAQMAIRGYEVHAIDFVLKPINVYALTLKLRRILRYLQQRQDISLVLETADGMEKISSRDLYYVEVNGHYLSFHAKQGVFRVRKTMHDIEEELGQQSFYKCNKCYLVNLHYVNAINKDEVRIGTEWLKISRPRKRQFLQAIADYLEGGNT
ncbi:LytR/AlgR family response regulator transcription factor [Clostridium vitabionis]|uniref:LytR/AlgR family response regulator transcription factor n=1 Tax=Clostridium vitabionis TaxID=2784388 RepID=UPI00188BF8D5|nr:LytTR family DNA-binding domain-containing protein [Clostridium vitabionis]